MPREVTFHDDHSNKTKTTRQYPSGCTCNRTWNNLRTVQAEKLKELSDVKRKVNFRSSQVLFKSCVQSCISEITWTNKWKQSANRPSSIYAISLNLGNIYRLLTARCMPLYMHLLRQNLTTLTLSYLSFDRIILTNFSSGKILPHVFWLVLGNMNIFNPS